MWWSLALSCAGTEPRHTGGGGDSAEHTGVQVGVPGSVLVLSIDTLRPQAVTRDTTPNLYALTHDAGVWADNTIVPGNYTYPGMVAAMTGLRLPQIGAAALYDGNGIPDDVTTLAERLSAEGWATRLDSASLLVGPEGNLAQGFGEVAVRAEDVDVALLAFQLTDTLAWASAQSGAWFAHVHAYEPHSPYSVYAEGCRAAAESAVAACPEYPLGTDRDAPGEMTDDSARWSDDVRTRCTTAAEVAYFCEVYALDEALAPLMAARASGALDDTLLVVHVDHGEGLGLHAFGHQNTPTTDNVAGLMWMDGPGVAGRTHASGRSIVAATGLADLVPSVLDLLGLPWSGDSGDGLPLWDATPERMVANHTCWRDSRSMVAVLTGDRMHAIRDGDRRFAMFDLAADPGELVNLAASEADVPPAVVAELDALYAEASGFCPGD